MQGQGIRKATEILNHPPDRAVQRPDIIPHRIPSSVSAAIHTGEMGADRAKGQRCSHLRKPGRVSAYHFGRLAPAIVGHLLASRGWHDPAPVPFHPSPPAFHGALRGRLLSRVRAFSQSLQIFRLTVTAVTAMSPFWM